MKAIVGSATPVLMDLAHSSVEMAVKSTIGSFVADLPIVEILVTATPGTSQIDSAVFRSSLAGIETGNADRDREMSDWQQRDRFPDVIFTLTALDPVRSGTSFARGRLRLKGAERSVSFPISIESKSQVIAIDGEFTIDTRDFELPVITKYYSLRVDPIVHLHFHLEGKLADS